MTGWSTDSKPGLSGSSACCYLCTRQGQSSLPASSSKPVSASRFTWHARLSWAGLLRATLLGLGVAYATTSLLGEYHYAQAHRETKVGNIVDEYRKAASIFPLNHMFRKGSALALTDIALVEPDKRWKEAAMLELEQALKTDPTSAVLLAPAITFELEMGKDEEAKAHYRMFRRVAKSSPLNGLVGK